MFGRLGDKQTSLYFKIALFRWVNTAVVITMVTPFTDTLSLEGGLIPQIYALFYAELTTTAAIQVKNVSRFVEVFCRWKLVVGHCMQACVILLIDLLHFCLLVTITL